MARYAIRVTTDHPDTPEDKHGEVGWVVASAGKEVVVNDNEPAEVFTELAMAQSVAERGRVEFWRHKFTVVDLDQHNRQPGFFLHVYGFAREPGQDSEDRAEAELYIGPCQWMQYTYGDLRIGFTNEDGNEDEVHGVPLVGDELVAAGRSWSDWTFENGAPADATPEPANAAAFDASVFDNPPKPEQELVEYRVTRHERWDCTITVKAAADDPTEAIDAALSPDGQEKFAQTDSVFVDEISDGYDVERIE